MARKAGKYAHITAKLPKINGVGSEYRDNVKYQERVDQTKREILMERGSDGEASVPSLKDAPALVLTDEDILRLLGSVEQNLKVLHRALLRRCAGKNQLTALAAAYAAARDLKDRIADWESNTNLLIEAYAQLMLDAADNEDVTSVRLGDRPVSWWEEPYTTVKDKAANLAWAARECEHCMAPKHEHRPSMSHDALVGIHQVTDPITQEIRENEHYFKPNDLRQSLMLPWQTLDSLVRRMLLEGAELPPGVEVFAKKKIRLGAGED